ncbi:MAG: DEAD/DEAH box helicase [Patescibacteria group bacterium]|nr:DEAD/DEAH box helicase [Patescibacteria group bacterium]
MSTTGTVLTACLLPTRDKIMINGTTPAMAEFMHSLPNARWHGGRRAWTCDATPAAAWRIASLNPSGPYELDDELSLMVCKFLQQIRNSQAITLLSEFPQPTLRNLDSWPHQVAAYHFAASSDAALLDMWMGTGKTKVVVDLIVNTHALRTLILCPCSVRSVWRREIERHAAKHVETLILDKGTTKQKTHSFLRVLESRHRAGAISLAMPLVVVINYETARMEPFARESLNINWDMVVLDESHRVAMPTTQISKHVAKLGLRAERRLCLTGTPMRNGPLDLFGQFRFLERGIFGTSWHHFRNRYAVYNRFIPQKIDGYKNQEELRERVRLLTFSASKEVLDLPGCSHNLRTVELSPKSRKTYCALRDELIADLESGVVRAANALTRLLRLQQVTAGFVGGVDDGTGETSLVEVGTEKADSLSDLFADIDPDDPVVVFSTFRHDLDIVRDTACRCGRRYGELSGRQNDLTPEGTMPEWSNVLGVQYQSGGVGVDLTRARYAVYFTPTFSRSNYDQSISRLHRPGQKREVICYRLVASGTVDELVYRALESKREVIESVLEGLTSAR